MTGELWVKISKQEPLIGLHILTVLSREPVAKKLLFDQEHEITSAMCPLNTLMAGRKTGYDYCLVRIACWKNPLSVCPKSETERLLRAY